MLVLKGYSNVPQPSFYYKFSLLHCTHVATGYIPSVLASGVLGVLWTPGPGVEDPWKSEHF